MSLDCLCISAILDLVPFKQILHSKICSSSYGIVPPLVLKAGYEIRKAVLTAVLSLIRSKVGEGQGLDIHPSKYHSLEPGLIFLTTNYKSQLCSSAVYQGIYENKINSSKLENRNKVLKCVADQRLGIDKET